jgi:hypothetical protein
VVGVVAQFGVPPNRVDLMNQIDGVSFSEAWKGRTADSAVLGGERVPLTFIGIRELVRNKEAMGRCRDLDHLKYLRQAGEGTREAGSHLRSRRAARR